MALRVEPTGSLPIYQTTMAATLDQTYAYVAPSACQLTGNGAALQLATSGGIAEHPRLFRGELRAPAVQATALLIVGRTARERFFLTGRNLFDPVVTCHADRLRFEALSSCASVYARHDTDLSGADGEVLRPGVTNVDFNPPTRQVLTRVASGSTLRLDIGEDGIALETERGRAVERKVPLPVRWVKGFAEVAVAQRALTPAFDLAGPLAQRFLRSLPAGGRGLFLAPGGREPRWSTVDAPNAIAISDPQRLGLLAPLARHATRLTVHAGPSGVSAWQLDSAAGRTHLVLSPVAWRGFSGEGGTLTSLAAEQLGPVADAVSLELAWQPTLGASQLAARTELPTPEVTAALDLIAARGRAGFDGATGAYFHRDLPYDLERVESLHPRLLAARAILDQGGVELVDGGAVAIVRSGSSEHRIRLTEHPPVCSCRWWAQHAGTRGPCKHVLAAELAAEVAAEVAAGVAAGPHA